MAEPRWHVVLVHPDQAGNVGNIGRTCLGLGCRLHLVKPCGFTITDAALKRAGMDYWRELDLVEHPSLEAWSASLAPAADVWLCSTRGARPLAGAPLSPGSHLVFGAESAGLPPSVWQRFGERSLNIPLDPRARSLNLATAVGVVLGAALAKHP